MNKDLGDRHKKTSHLNKVKMNYFIYQRKKKYPKSKWFFMFKF